MQWDNSNEYTGLDAPELQADLDRVLDLTETVKNRASGFAPYMDRADALDAEASSKLVAQAQEASTLFYQAYPLLNNVLTFAYCELSLDGRNEGAKSLIARTQSLYSKLGQAIKPVSLFLSRTSEEVVEAYLKDADRAPERFDIMQERTLKDTLLPLNEESTIMEFSVNGISAWGNLYENLAGEITCKVELPDGEKTMGLAQAASLAEDPDLAVRKAGYEAVQNGWKQHETTCAAALNALSGWRLSLFEKRSHTQPVHFLHRPAFDGRVTREIIDCMWETVHAEVDTSRQVLRNQAKVLGMDQLGPWDLFVPPPASEEEGRKIPYQEALTMIREAFGSVSGEMADFVTLMEDNHWIDGREGDNKLPGAYCTGFLKSRTPRVYITYLGGMKDVITLAHELGHALHSWVMRDMPLAEVDYPMTLAETASVFAEAVMYDYLIQQAGSREETFRILWDAARELPSFLVNIPARYDFEKSLYEARADKFLSPSEISDLNVAAWKKWYGDSLSEMDPMFWAWKAHFYITGLGFYNYPYSFGYLFSLGVYARKQEMGAGFYDAYVALLRDSGRMTANEVARKHLDTDLTQPDFWNQSLGIAAHHAAEFEKVLP